MKLENATAHSRSGGLRSAESSALIDVAEALRERLAIIQDAESRRNPDAHITRLRAVSEKIDKLQAALPPGVDPRLAHYLERRSYEKALEFIESL